MLPVTDPIFATQIDTAPPALAEGGALHDGTYDLVGVTFYTYPGSATGPIDYDSGSQHALRIHDHQISWNQSGAFFSSILLFTDVATGTIVERSGHEIRIAQTCPGHATERMHYTATRDTLTVFVIETDDTVAIESVNPATVDVYTYARRR